MKKVRDTILATKVNGKKYLDPIIGWSSKGGAMRANIKEMAMKSLRAVCPDLADEDGKRVLWLSDMHGSRLFLGLLDDLNKMGVTLFIYLRKNLLNKLSEFL